MRSSGGPCAGRRVPPRDAGVRGVHIADHFHDQVVQFLVVGDVRQQALVFVLGGRPIDAVHFGIVEAILHHAPGFFEDLAALGRDIDFHLHGEGDAPRGRARGGRLGGGAVGGGAAASTAPAASGAAPPRQPRTCRQPAAGSRRASRAAALQEVDAAAVARPLRLIDRRRRRDHRVRDPPRRHPPTSY